MRLEVEIYREIRIGNLDSNWKFGLKVVLEFRDIGFWFVVLHVGANLPV